MAQQQPSVYPGALHIHTRYSDGSGTIPDVVSAAREAGLHWIIITDHDTLHGRKEAGWHDDVLVLVEHEITPVRSHFLAFGVDEVINRHQPAQQYIDAVYQQGGFGVMAHPDDHLPDRQQGIHPWADWEVNWPAQTSHQTSDQADNQTSIGIEIWNLMSDWRSNRKQLVKPELYTNPEKVIMGPTPAVLEWWDRLNVAGKRAFAIGGLDAHATRMHHAGQEYTLFPYAWMCAAVTMFLLLDEPLPASAEQAQPLIYRALREGRSYIVNRLHGTPPALPFGASNGNQHWQIGDTATLAGGTLTLTGEAGLPAELRLVHNGEVIANDESRLQRVVDSPGVYRLEGLVDGHPWLYTNPIYVCA